MPNKSANRYPISVSTSWTFTFEKTMKAILGTTVHIAKNPNNKETYIDNGEYEGFNQYHVNTLYDLMNRTYADAIIQGIRKTNEPQAVADMIDYLPLRGKTILIGDRGYGAMNLIEHCNRKDGLGYLFRVKEDWISEVKTLPMVKEFDKEIHFQILIETQRRAFIT